MLRIIDLRGTDPAGLSGGKLAGVLPRAALDVEKATEAVRPVCEDVRQRGAAAVREYTARFDGVDLATTRVPAAALADAGRRAGPGRAGRAGGGRPAGAAGARGPAARRAGHRARRRARPSPSGTSPVGRAGVYVPGGLVALPVLGGDERHPGPGRRGQPRSRWPRRPAPRTAACPPRPCWPPARCSASRGARGRRGPGHRDVRVRHRRLRRRPTWSPAPATSTSPRPSGC